MASGIVMPAMKVGQKRRRRKHHHHDRAMVMTN
jgi:hypothetical protein